MKVNKKGFTLIELLVAIVLMLSISALAIVAYSNMTKTNRKDQYNSVVSQIETAAEQYFTNNSYLFDNYERYGVATIRLKTLIKNDFMGVAIDPRNKSKINGCSYVEVIKDNGNYTAIFHKSRETSCSDAVVVEYSPTKWNEIAAPVTPPESPEPPELANEYKANEYKVGEIDYYNINYKKLSKKSNNYMNIESFFEKEIMDRDDQKLYVCVDFNKSEIKNTSKVEEELKNFYKLITPGSDGAKELVYTKNLQEANQVILYCNSYDNDFRKEEKYFSLNKEDGTSVKSKLDVIGKDTEEPKINILSTNNIKKGSVVNTLVNVPINNTLYFEAIMTDNIAVNENGVTSSIKGGFYTQKNDAEVRLVVTGLNVNDDLVYNPFSDMSSRRYVYPVDLNVKDEAGNSVDDSATYYGYTACEDSSKISQLLIKDQIKICIKKTKIIYYDRSYYDKNIDFGEGKAFRYYVCKPDRGIEMKENDIICTALYEATQGLACTLKNNNWCLFPGCPLLSLICKEPKVETGGEEVSQVNVKNNLEIQVKNKSTGAAIFSGTYDSNQTIDLNKNISRSWFNGKDYPEGLTIEVVPSDNDSYSYSITSGDTSKTESKNESGSTKVYNVINDGYQRKATIKKGGIEVTLIMNIDLTPPTVTASNITKAKCGGADGVSSTLKVTDITSKPQVAYYYFGNNTGFDATIQEKVSHVKGNGSQTLTYTDTWSNGCKISRCTGGKCINVGPDHTAYKLKVRAYDNAGNTADGFSNYASW